MHLSETKKGLDPGLPWLKAKSALFLRMDRFFAIATTLYFFLVFVAARSSIVVLGFGAALIVSLLGEVFDRSYHYIPYVLCHLVWHFAVGALVNAVL